MLSAEVEARAPQFDFQAHRSKSVDQFRAVRGVYEAFVNAVREILLGAIPHELQIHSIEARAKALDSFAVKACLPSNGDSSAPQYPKPMDQITDLAGVRVIAFFRKTLESLNEIISSEFNVIERIDKAEELIAKNKFGYQSIHYLVKLKAPRTSLPEYRKYEELTAEIQVRTILQHAWAEMEHDIQYKSEAEIPSAIRRRFMSLAGMLEIADREFQAIQDDDEQRRERDRSAVQQDLDGVDGVVDLKKTAARIETQIRENQEARPSAPTYLSGSARALVDKGYFEEAVRAYDRVVGIHPTVHTNFIGRARAKFLASDADGALRDLLRAEKLYPFDPVIERLRLEFGGGERGLSPPEPHSAWLPTDDASTVPGRSRPAQGAVWEGNNKLAAGDAAGAFADYTRAQELGLSQSYSRFNQAMALCLGKQKEKAMDLLDQIVPDQGSYTEVNVSALRYLCSLLQPPGPSSCPSELKSLTRAVNFNYDKSQLRFLEKGTWSDEELREALIPVFDILRAGG